jgi:tol-pal system protein YbgF
MKTTRMRGLIRAGLLAVAAPLLLSACATKGDVRNMRWDLERMQARQDSVLFEIQRQNQLLLDSIRASIALTVDARGTTAAQLRQFETNVSQLGQLVGQVMGSLSRIEQRLTGLDQRPGGAAPGGAAPGGGTAEEYYGTGLQMMSQQSYATARMAFEQLIREFPEHERAPDAQFQVGQAFYHEQQFDSAYAALERVAEQWAEAPRAPAALFRAGAIAEERRDFARARRYFERVRSAYPRSDEARQAQQKLQSLPRR